MYDPTVGRWLSNDPIGFAAGDTNLQRYVGNSPTNYVDPTGLLQVGLFWDGALLGAQHYQLPTHLVQWAHDANIDVSVGSFPEYTELLGFNELYIGDLEARHFVQFGNAGRIVPGPIVPSMGAVYNELFHAWWDQVGEERIGAAWIRELMWRQSQFGSDQMAKAEEAMSEVINLIINELEVRHEIPTYDEIRQTPLNHWLQGICPGHTGKDEFWPNDPGAKQPMREELYYATIWILHNGFKNPLPHRQTGFGPLDGLTDGDILRHLKEFFVKVYRPNWTQEQIGAFLIRPPEEPWVLRPKGR